MDNVILEINHLSVEIKETDGFSYPVSDASLSLQKGEVLAVVGESGSGKTIVCRSIMGILPGRARISSGEIILNGRNMASFSEKEMRKLRGRDISMVFQDPMTSLNPTMCVGDQIAEVFKIHCREMKREEIHKKVCELMDMVGIENPTERYKLYPYNFSGGMRQRCVIALALALNPTILIADEPTTALDVTVQAQILDLLKSIKENTKTSMILVSHDFGVVAGIADRVVIMKKGKVLETGTAREIFHNPKHEYTRHLLDSLPYNKKLKRDGRV